MDILAHGAYNLALQKTIKRKQSKRQVIEALAWGMMPDAIAFGPSIIFSLLAGAMDHHAVVGGTDFSTIIYSYSHSLVIFGLVLGIVYLFKKRLYLPMLGWGLHILLDIPLHTPEFYPTPFLFPLSDYTVPFGIYWGTSYIWIASWVIVVVWLLIVAYKNRKI